MARSRIVRLLGGGALALLAVAVLGRGSDARAQTAPMPIAPPPADLAAVLNASAPGPAIFPPITGAQPSSIPGPGRAPAAPRVQLGLFETMSESLFGDV